MDTLRQAYYISIADGGIFQNRESSPWDFKIEATADEIAQLRNYFDHKFEADEAGFYRAHIPFWEYHNDQENEEADANLQKVYNMIYLLGDAEAKRHIKGMGIVDEIT
ncbi:hydrolase [Bacillus massiliglaciei]|uniref:hydrolase n=1 Tax=Bacillus massiliglaciei TaxID=1816693 RepID=UPI000DA5F6B1|nr:hydrolase [Bacillus massiliglaciei]